VAFKKEPSLLTEELKWDNAQRPHLFTYHETDRSKSLIQMQKRIAKSQKLAQLLGMAGHRLILEGGPLTAGSNGM
jgi:hypothetical protein